jgi:hypothetical protein
MTNVKRIRLEGHTEITAAGEKYFADEDGCFTVPESVASQMIDMVGKDEKGQPRGAYVPGLDELEEKAEAADAQVVHFRRQLVESEAAAEKAHDDVETYMAKSKTASAVVARQRAQHAQHVQNQGTKK